MTQTKPSAENIIREHWGSDAPAWVLKLGKACDATSQAKVATQINRSPSLVNQVLKNKYKGDLKDVQQRVERAYADGGISCPVLGNISGEKCLRHQKAPYNPGNHMAVRMYLACRRCPHSKEGSQ